MDAHFIWTICSRKETFVFVWYQRLHIVDCSEVIQTSNEMFMIFNTIFSQMRDGFCSLVAQEWRDDARKQVEKNVISTYKNNFRKISWTWDSLRCLQWWIIFDSLNIHSRSDSRRWQNKHLILIWLQTIKSHSFDHIHALTAESIKKYKAWEKMFIVLSCTWNSQIQQWVNAVMYEVCTF